MSSHTPGPWQAIPTHFKEGFTVLAQASTALRGFTKLIAYVGDKADEETAANARLIAAAPDLLAALKEAAEFIQPFNRAADLLDRIEAAISKAGGASS